MCEKARLAKGGKHSKNDYVDRSRFCPHPDTDLTYICEVGGWYFADRDQHQKKMAGLDSLSSFWNNEFNFTIDQFFKEVHDNYERCRNNCSQMNLDTLTYDTDLTAAQGFVIPVCSNDNNRLADFSKKGPTRWHFPSVCGDFTSNETEQFMKAANMGPNSQVATTQSIQELFRDRIPRVINIKSPCISLHCLLFLGA